MKSEVPEDVPVIESPDDTPNVDEDASPVPQRQYIAPQSVDQFTVDDYPNIFVVQLIVAIASIGVVVIVSRRIMRRVLRK